MSINVKDQEFLQAFGRNLKCVRKEKDFTISQLANTASISYSQICRIESAQINPTICTVNALAKALEVTPSVLTDF